MSTISISIEYCEEVTTSTKKAKEWNKRYKEKTQSTLSLFTDDMVICKENPKEYKYNTSNKQLENKLFFKFPLKIASKNITFLGINLLKDFQDLSTQNDGTLLKEIKGN